MWNSKEIAERALQRAELLRKRRAIRKRRIYTTLVVTVCLAAVVILAVAIPTALTNAPGVNDAGIYGAAMATAADFGAYVLVAVIAFALGCAVTIFCYKVLLKKGPRGTNERDEDNSSL